MERLIEARWEWHLWPPSAGWRVNDFGTSRYFPLSWRHLRRMPESLRAAGVKSRFKSLIHGAELAGWWGQTCSDREDTVFCLRFPQGRWNIPWELLIAELYSAKKRARTCIVRALESDVPASPRVFHEPLRILILQGDDGAFMDAPIDFAAEIRELMSAWDTLEKGVQECVPRPLVEIVTKDNLAPLLAAHRPHILWFSGHGEAKPSRLLLSPQTWMPVAEFAARVKASGHPPLYAIFWACETANAEDATRDAPPPPALFEGLRSAGVLSMLAMQAPIRDVIARAMAADFLRFLALGLPLEIATARVRANQMDRAAASGAELDWACPVVWSAGERTGRLHWNAGASGLMEFQLLGRLIIRLHLAPAGELESPPSADELERANVWASHPRVWVAGSSEGQHRYKWARILRAIQTETTAWVIALDFQNEDAATALRRWAEDVSGELLPGDVPDEIALIVSEMRRTPDTGWHKLCQRPEMILALSGRVPPDAAEWFWVPLRSTQASPRVVVLSEKTIDEGIYRHWLVDSLGTEMSETAITTAIAEAPDLARALAVLNIPLQSHRIKISAPDVAGARSLAEWHGSPGLLIQTPAGPLIAATARHAVLAELSSADRQKAHRNCVEMLGEPTLALSTHFREHRLAHLLAAGEYSELAIEEAALLCGVYRGDERPMAVLSVVQRLGGLRTGLPSSSKLIVAWAHLRLGQVEAAQFWLRQATVLAAPLEIAEKHGLTAEILKSTGTPDSKRAALAEIEAAIEVCAAAARKNDASSNAARRMERAYRQDHARILQYLFYDRRAAAAEYESLLSEWSNEPEAEIDRAVVLRNLAECLRNMADAPDQAQRVRELIAEAEHGLQRHPEAPILAELLYEKSKAAEYDGDATGARRYLNDCRATALKSRHHLVFAIAENRHFWRYESFNEQRWQDIKMQLASFSPHGWAVRACIDGRLRVARLVEARGDLERAYSELSENLHAFREHPSFDAGSDRFRIAATSAGLEVLAARLGRDARPWQEFVNRYAWAAEWLATRGANTPQQIWSEV